eukprot:g4219.t1
MFSRLKNEIALALLILGSGVLAGLYFIFSICVMPALDQLDEKTAITVMNTINVVIINPAFMLVFMGTPLLAVLFGLATLANCWWTKGAAPSNNPLAIAESRRGGKELYYAMLAVGVLLIVIGEFGITAGINVPLNDALADVENKKTQMTWKEYSKPWTFWNSVRGTNAALATLCFAYVGFASGAGGAEQSVSAGAGDGPRKTLLE